MPELQLQVQVQPRDSNNNSSKLDSGVARAQTACLFISPLTALEPTAPPAAANMETAGPLMRTTYRSLTSKTAQRTLLTTVLLTAAAAVLYGLAAVAYLVVYNTYLPDQVATLPIHLHYGVGPNPWGVSPLRNLKDHQAYDISLTLTLPASPANLDRGNFMIGLYLLDHEGTAAATTTDGGPVDGGRVESEGPRLPAILPGPSPQTVLSTRAVLHAVSRPALAPYTDPLVSLATRLLLLPSHILFPRPSTTTITIPLVERLSFPNSNRHTEPISSQPAPPGHPNPTTTTAVPSTLFLEVRAGQTLRVAAAAVTVTARLAGARWFMRRHRAAAFLLGTAAFWACEVLAMALAWAALSAFLSRPPSSSSSLPAGTSLTYHDAVARGKGGGGRGRGSEKALMEDEDEVKEEDMSDTERTFPTTGRQPPLRYESAGGRAVVKSEKDGGAMAMAEIPLPPGVVADDEDDPDEDEDDEAREEDRDDDGGWRDSGIGTSYSDAAGTGAGSEVRKRGVGRR